MRTVPAEMEAQYRRFLESRGDAARSLFAFLRASQRGQSDTGAWAALVLSRIFIVKGRVDLALSYLDLSRRFFLSARGSTVPYGLDVNRAVIMKTVGRRIEAEEILRKILKDSIGGGDAAAAAKSAVNLALLAPDPEEADDLLEYALVTYANLGREIEPRRVELARAFLRQRLGFHEQAVEHSEILAEKCRGPLLSRERIQAVILAAESLLELGEYSKFSLYLEKLSGSENEIALFRPLSIKIDYLKWKFFSKTGERGQAAVALSRAEAIRRKLGLPRSIFGISREAASGGGGTRSSAAYETGSAWAYLEPRKVGGAGGGVFLTSSPILISELERLKESCHIDLPVLIEGESGVGKEIVSRFVHAWGGRSGKRFIAVNAAAMPHELFESILFGHVRGAFTSASASHPGLVESAAGGTIFLDEIGDLQPELQAKLLRFLETGEYMRVGDNNIRVSRISIVTATNMDLEALVRAGRFRRDLYYRLAAFRIRIPPLRDRKGDIRLLCGHILQGFSGHYGFGSLTCGEPVLGLMERYEWPGNVRELRNELVSAAVKRKSGVIGIADMSHRFLEAAFGSAGKNADDSLDGKILSMERDEILSALSASRGNRTRASGILGIKRTTLIYRMKRCGID